MKVRLPFYKYENPLKLFFHKLSRWEYWPFQIVYIPIYFLWAYYSVKAKTIFFFNASNPAIRNGGFIMDSKIEIYGIIPQQYYPKTELIKEGTPFGEVLQAAEASGLDFPLVAKPDMGLRGTAVKKINTPAALKAYAEKADFDYVIQDLIPFANEVGIFYVRYPDEKEGRITGIVAKEFLMVRGDGTSTIESLVRKNPRHEMQLKALRKEYGPRLKEILPLGEILNLVPYGNHARGAKFMDMTNWITPKLTEVINEMCLQIPGFYFGRLDVMYSNFKELEKGNFLLVELNGASSEPTHIYDPKHSLFFAWKELARHIRYMFEISLINNKKGIPFLTYKEGIRQYRLDSAVKKKIASF
ncbi:MAG TPA: D-alanine--D-alanine ligase [Flavobacterium sp.]|nr:D-alanine--D-alanine ligase [Flavobacterium sp.]